MPLNNSNFYRFVLNSFELIIIFDFDNPYILIPFQKNFVDIEITN